MMRPVISIATLFLLYSIAHTSASGVQKPGLQQSPLAKARQNEVKQAFASAFADYMKFGFPTASDQTWPKYPEWMVIPACDNPLDSVDQIAKIRSASLVDSLDTLFVMGLQDEFEKGISKTLKIDFSRSQTSDKKQMRKIEERWEQDVSLFETTIRYLGGILVSSAYELSGSSHQGLLKQAQKLGDKLMIAWPDSSQNLPFPRLDFGRHKPVFEEASTAEILVAEVSRGGHEDAGSLILEFERLSYHTQDPKYLRQASKAMQAIMNTPSTFPGLAGFTLTVQSQQVKEDWATWGGKVNLRRDWDPDALRSDGRFSSYYEYLLKYGIMSNNQDKSYLEGNISVKSSTIVLKLNAVFFLLFLGAAWKRAVKSSTEHLIQVSPVHNLTYLANFSAKNGGIRYEFSHLGCFADFPGGNWLLGGRVLKDPSTFQLGLRLVETCMETYKRTATGLGPETFGFLGPHGEYPAKRPNSQVASPMIACALDFYNDNGFFIERKSYILRQARPPEVVESAFYAWRLTGDTRYQDFVWDAFQSLQKHCKAPASFSSIQDVDSLPAMLTDDSEIALLALLKHIVDGRRCCVQYIYLTFADPNLLSLDEFVFTLTFVITNNVALGWSSYRGPSFPHSETRRVTHHVKYEGTVIRAKWHLRKFWAMSNHVVICDLLSSDLFSR
ncbi:uncharacterized protein VP01_536g1 [Puccinia sorghi]|uniref:mannosyl-oligosaccharide 1,2-alpha-mannosidase n=1 Tax=Puccinia sorghi TaxID=27349 RepID=A0A0L6UKR7_9BASI|nr:uncharacterized protein VP01_536g1 [Puccinia sorghi]